MAIFFIDAVVALLINQINLGIGLIAIAVTLFALTESYKGQEIIWKSYLNQKLNFIEQKLNFIEQKIGQVDSIRDINRIEKKLDKILKRWEKS